MTPNTLLADLPERQRDVANNSAERPRLVPEGFLSISQLVEQTGVTRATIHHYSSMGILPKAVKTAHNMAYYDPACISIIDVVKELRARHVPLSRITQLLEQQGVASIRSMLALAARESLELSSFVNTDTLPKPKDEIVSSCGLSLQDISYLENLGLLRSTDDGIYDGLSVDLIRSLTQMRLGGMTQEMGFNPADVAIYKQSMELVVQSEIEYFESRLLGKVPPEEIPRVIRTALEHAESICMLTRRRLLLDKIELLSKAST